MTIKFWKHVHHVCCFSYWHTCSKSALISFSFGLKHNMFGNRMSLCASRILRCRNSQNPSVLRPLDIGWIYLVRVKSLFRRKRTRCILLQHMEYDIVKIYFMRKFISQSMLLQSRNLNHRFLQSCLNTSGILSFNRWKELIIRSHPQWCHWHRSSSPEIIFLKVNGKGLQKTHQKMIHPLKE